MNVCLVCSGNYENDLGFSVNKSPVYEQGESIKNLGVNVSYFLIHGKGIFGYLKNVIKIKSYLRKNEIDIIHAHSGLIGMLVVISTFKKVVVTYHGTDINSKFERLLSGLASLRASLNIYVSDELLRKSIFKRRSFILPCGVNTNFFKPFDKIKARKKLNLNENERIILFSSRFNNKNKNSSLAFDSIKKLNYQINLQEIKDRTRKEVMLLVNASDFILKTSNYEGSPQIIKEALACNKPIISLDVGDVKNRIKSINNCFIVDNKPKSIGEIINFIYKNKIEYSNGRESMFEISLDVQAKKLVKKYKEIINL